MRLDLTRPLIFALARPVLVLLLREEDVRALLSVPRAIELLDGAFRMESTGDARNIPRARALYPGGSLQLMGGSVSPRQRAGVKTYAAGHAGVSFLVVLFDTGSNSLLALLEADWLGRIRTGAASGLATRYMGSNDARIAGIIGAGGQAETQVLALDAVRDLDEIRIFSLSPERREALVQRLTGSTRARLRAVSSSDEAVRESDIVTTITTSEKPVFSGASLAANCHVNAAGGNLASKTEIDVTTVSLATLVVVDSVEQARIECGDLLAAEREGDFSWDQAVPLSTLIARAGTEAAPRHGITLYESQGIGIEDVMVADYVYEQALEREMGQQVDFGS